MAPQDKIADAPAKNRFVAALVAHPCACACGIFVLAVVVSIIGPMTLIGSGDDLFASEGSYDIHHATAETQVQLCTARLPVIAHRPIPRAAHQDAFMLAVDVTEPKIDAVGAGRQAYHRSASPNVYLGRTRWSSHAKRRGRECCCLSSKPAVTTFVSAVPAVPVGAFAISLLSSCVTVTADNLAVMKAINDKITQNSQFSEFCLRPKNASITTCELPLMPTNVFYGTEDPKLTSAELALFDDSRVRPPRVLASPLLQ